MSTGNCAVTNNALNLAIDLERARTRIDTCIDRSLFGDAQSIITTLQARLDQLGSASDSDKAAFKEAMKKDVPIFIAEERAKLEHLLTLLDIQKRRERKKNAKLARKKIISS